MSASESTSSGKKASGQLTALSKLLKTARRHYHAGHYGIALTALEQASKEDPDNESIEVAMAYLRTNMVALKARDAGMPVNTPEPPPFFVSDSSPHAEQESDSGFKSSSTMELDAELPENENRAEGENRQDRIGRSDPTSSVELEAMLPDATGEGDEPMPGFDQGADKMASDRIGSSLELDALPPEDSEEISLESFGDREETSSPTASPPPKETLAPDGTDSGNEEEQDDLFSQEDLDLLASDEDPVGALSTQGAGDALDADQKATVRLKPLSDGFPEDEPTIARTPQQAASPSAFASAVAQAQKKLSPARTVSQDPQLNVTFEARPDQSPMEPSSMTITGMPLPDFLKEEATGDDERKTLDNEAPDQSLADEEAETITRAHAPSETDSFDEQPTTAKDYAARPAQDHEGPTIVRQSPQSSSHAFDEAPTIARESIQPASDAFDDAPTIARHGLSHPRSGFADHAPTMMRSPDQSTITGDGDWTAAPVAPSGSDDESLSSPTNERFPASGEQSALLPSDQDSLSLGQSDVPEGMLSDADAIERDTWRRKKDQGRPRPQDLLEEARQLFDRGEHTKSLEICMRVSPVIEDSEDLERLIRENEDILTSRYIVQLGGLDAIPEVTFEGQDLQALGMDHRKAFLLTRIDGVLSIDEVLMISGMSRLETARALMELKLAGLLSIDEGDDHR